MADPLTLFPPAVALVAAAVAVLAPWRRVGVAVGTGLSATTVAWIALVPPGTHGRARLFGFEVVPFAVDPLSRTVGGVLAGIAGVSVLYGYGTGASRRGTALTLSYVGAGIGAVFVGDWLTLLVAWEALAVAATALVWTTGDDAARRAGLRYAVYHELGGLAVVVGVALQYTATGTFLFGGGLVAGLPVLLGVAGIGLNVGFVGLHPWLVDTYPRPHVATSVVLAAVTTKVGVYALARAVPDGGVVLAYLGGAMVLVGVTYAILQTDVRRLLTYHVVSQVGFMVVGVGLGSPLGLAGAAAHLVNNVLYKSLLFAVAGVLVLRTGQERLKRMGGLARAMPVTFVVFLVAAAAIAGVPGFNGFVSKGLILDATEDAGYGGLWWALLVGSVGTVVSFLKFGYYAFLGEPHATESVSGDGTTVERAPPAATAAMLALAVPCVVFGVVPSLQFAVLPGDTTLAKPFSTSQFLKTGPILAAGGTMFLLLRAPLARVARVRDLDAVYHPLGRAGQRLVADGTGGVGARIDAVVSRATRTVATVATDPGRLRGRRIVLGTDGLSASLLLVVLTLAVLLAVLLV